MIKIIGCNEYICPRCRGQLKYYDSVKRILRTKGGLTKKVIIRRFHCLSCGAFHREIPDILFPHKQYEAEIITGVVEGLITCETLGYEDYPCEMTMNRWRIELSNKF